MLKATFHRALFAAALLALPLTALARPLDGPPVTMTEQGLAEWRSNLPSEAKMARGLREALEGCDCPSKEARAKEAISYFDGLFHFAGYHYGDTVREYLRARFARNGEYDDADREAMEASDILTYVSPAVYMLNKGARTRGYLIQQWVMTESAVAESKKLLNAN